MGYLTREVLANYTKAMMLRTESVNFLTTSNLPFLFIIGTEDNAVPFASSMQQCYLPKTSYFHIMNGVGHMGMFELPERFLKITTDFLHEV
jgi:pimeloyl-ACP methyl ester carboxylesterase